MSYSNYRAAIFNSNLVSNIFLKLYIKYFRTVPVVVVVVHCLMALKDQISVKSLAVIVKCLKFCRAGCHNERTLKLNPI